MGVNSNDQESSEDDLCGPDISSETESDQENPVVAKRKQRCPVWLWILLGVLGLGSVVGVSVLIVCKVKDQGNKNTPQTIGTDVADTDFYTPTGTQDDTDSVRSPHYAVLLVGAQIAPESEQGVLAAALQLKNLPDFGAGRVFLVNASRTLCRGSPPGGGAVVVDPSCQAVLDQVTAAGSGVEIAADVRESSAAEVKSVLGTALNGCFTG